MTTSKLWALVACAVACLWPATAVQPKELQDWFASADGLAMSAQDAAALADKSWKALTQCGVTIQTLAALKAAMYDVHRMDMPLADVRQQLLPLAEQHVAPEKLLFLDEVLGSAAARGGLGLALPRAEAAARAIDMARRRAEPEQLQALYKVMRNPAFRLDLGLSQKLAIQQASAGADAARFLLSYTRTRSLTSAVADSVNGYLNGVSRRYAKDAAAYTAPEFQTHYGANWMLEWLAAPVELRVADDRRAYTPSEFATFYKDDWARRFASARVATQRRLAEDGEVYSIADFQKYYSDAWQQKWAAAPELPCDECAPYVDEIALV